jgi:flavodoxin
MPETTQPTIHAIYATTSGNTEFVIDTVAEIWRTGGWTVETHRAERTSPDLIAQNSLFLFGTSTWDRGSVNPFFTKLYEAMKHMSFAGKSGFFVGSGDNRYEPIQFNMGIQQIMECWKNQGGVELYHPLKINGEPHTVLDVLIRPWAQATVAELEKFKRPIVLAPELLAVPSQTTIHPAVPAPQAEPIALELSSTPTLAMPQAPLSTEAA